MEDEEGNGVVRENMSMQFICGTQVNIVGVVMLLLIEGEGLGGYSNY